MSFSTSVGEIEVAIVAPSQQTFEPGVKSDEELTSTSYRAAPGIGFHEKRGSYASGAGFRSSSCVAVAEGQSQLKEATGVETPRLPSASTGVTLQ